MPDLDALLAQLITSDPDEPFSLGELVVQLGRQYPTARAAEIRWMTLELIRNLLVTGTAMAGSLAPDVRRLRPWALTPDQALARITREWDELGRAPRVGEIVWLARVTRVEAMEDPLFDDEAGPGDA
jgi:hypothetical protein